MSCGGFTCSKNSLIALNIMYIIVSFILISVAAYGQTSNLVASVSIIGGIIACGVFLLLVAMLGLLGAVRHNQVLLFFYMVLLFLIFLIQFSIACACLAMSDEQQRRITKAGWRNANDKLKTRVQEYFECCSYDYESRNETDPTNPMSHPPCNNIKVCCYDRGTNCCLSNSPNVTDCSCNPCTDYLQDAVDSALGGSGGIGLFFSFTEIIGLVITYQYRQLLRDGLA